MMATSRYLIGAAALTTEPFTVAQNELQYRNQTIKTVIILQKITSRAGQLAELEQPAEGKLQLWAAAEGRTHWPPTGEQEAVTSSRSGSLAGAQPHTTPTPHTHTHGEWEVPTTWANVVRDLSRSTGEWPARTQGTHATPLHTCCSAALRSAA